MKGVQDQGLVAPDLTAAITGIACSLNEASAVSSFWQRAMNADAVKLEAGTNAKSLNETAYRLVDQALVDAQIRACASCATFVAVNERHDALSIKTGIEEAFQTRALPRPTYHASANFVDAVQSAFAAISSRERETVVLLQLQICDRGWHGVAVLLETARKASQDGRRIYCTIAGVESGAKNKTTNLMEEAWSSIGLWTCNGLSEEDVNHLAKGAPRERAALAIDSSKRESEALLLCALALYHRVLPATNSEAKLPSQFYVNEKARSWIYPKTHASVEQKIRDSLGFEAIRGRSAAMRLCHQNGCIDVILTEFDDPMEAQRDGWQWQWHSELCLLASHSSEAILARLSQLESFLLVNPLAALKDVAYTLSIEAVGPIKLAIVAHSLSDLLDKVRFAIEQLTDAQSLAKNECVYWSNRQDVRQGGLAFILPGLGAAYPNMLFDLALQFPDVRAAFDFVDQLATASGEKSLPSKLIFPWPPGAMSNAATTAILASMDAAVVTVLMAEWALYTVLKSLGVRPDILIGCSTGEFAALAIADSVEIVGAAPMFYRLSTALARSVPKESLLELRSLRIVADFDRVNPLVQDLRGVYLAADLSPQQHLLSGSKEAIALVGERLETAKIEFHKLPIAIPYHTPQVAGFLSANHKEIKQLPLAPPALPAWSCATAAPYPEHLEAIHELTTELFTKPIRFKQTVRKAYERGITKFVEVGPKGTLTPIVSEILAGSPHLSLASNLSSQSGITQLHHLLAALNCADVPLNLSYLFARRQPALLPIFLSPARGDQVEAPSKTSMSGPAAEKIMSDYLSGLASFHAQMMQVQSSVLTAYLAGCAYQASSAELASVKDNQGFGQNWEHSQLPFIERSIVTSQSDEGAVELSMHLTLDQHRFLLDHAIGGSISSSGEKVYLLPLTVALEMMAEAASLLVPNLKVQKLQNVRATKRVRIKSAGCAVRIAATLDLKRSNLVSAELYLAQDKSEPERLSDGKPMMSCEVVFATHYSPATASQQGSSLERSSKLSPTALYGQGAMFHGPTMQSVERILSVGERSLTASALVRQAAGWFAGTTAPRFLCDPLLLDNATQAVLFYLFENNHDVSALLPFLIESIEFYDDLALHHNKGVKLRLAILQNGANGTQSDISIIDDTGKCLVAFTNVMHKSIWLPKLWQELIARPAQTFLSKELPAIPAVLPHSAFWSVASLGEEILPKDDAALLWCTDYILSEDEQIIFTRLPNARRRREWLNGRIAVKEAVRRLVLRQGGDQLCCADIEIEHSADGQPVVSASTVVRLGWRANISISHKDGLSVAIAGHPEAAQAAGIDIETAIAREDGFETLAFSERERRWLAVRQGAERTKLATQLWCAKEATGKALGIGLSNNPRSIQIAPQTDLEETGAHHLTMVAHRADQIDSVGYLVHCFDEPSDKVVAVTALEPAHKE